MRHHLLSFVLALSLSHCGVEVGNPGTKPTVGALNISFAREPFTNKESLSLDLASLDLVEGDDGSVVITSLTPSVQNVDLFGLTEGDETLVAESSTVPVGVYNRVVVRLSGDNPVRYRDREGAERPVQLEEKSTQAFYVEQSFEITGNQTTSLVLSLDPYGSLNDLGGPDRGLIFKPRGDVRRHERNLSYRSETTAVDAAWICAYAYSVRVMPPPTGAPPMRDGSGQALPPPPLTGVRVTDRVTFETKEAIIKDETSECANAFAKVPVLDGKYEFRHLLPASFSLRIFTSSGAVDDSAQDFTLDAGFPGGPPSGGSPLE